MQGVSGIKLTIFYSLADISTAERQISILFAEDCWALRRPHSCIRYVAMVSQLRNSLRSMEGVLGMNTNWAIFYLTAHDFTTERWILILFVGGCSAHCQLPSLKG